MVTWQGRSAINDHTTASKYFVSWQHGESSVGQLATQLVSHLEKHGCGGCRSSEKEKIPAPGGKDKNSGTNIFHPGKNRVGTIGSTVTPSCGSGRDKISNRVVEAV